MTGLQPPFVPKDWYWIAADGRIFSSARQANVAASDAAYIAWLAAGGIATVWPKDDSGNQTDTSLQAALMPYGLYSDLTAYAAAARYTKETGGITVSGMPVATDRASQAMINAAYNMAKNDGTFTTKWKNPDGSFTALNATTIIAIAVAVGNHVSACFAKEADIVAGISAATIVTMADVDAAFATVTT
jgi:hypothetical protein